MALTTKWKELTRNVFALLFFAGAGAHIYLVSACREVYDSFADLAFLRCYTSMWRTLILPHLTLWVVALIVFELTVAVLLTLRGRAVTIGLVMAGLFVLFLIPFWWSGGAVVNVVLFVPIVWLVFQEFPRSTWQRISEVLRELLRAA